MYSETVIPIKSDGQLHRRETPAPAPRPVPRPAPKPLRNLLPKGIDAELLLILVIAYVILQNDKPDYMLLLALAYILL